MNHHHSVLAGLLCSRTRAHRAQRQAAAHLYRNSRPRK
jgi:hypothetical protein